MTETISAADPLQIAQNWFEQGRRIALVTVLSVWGSAPRPAGSHMICDAQGNFEGSVSGGCIEAEVIAQAAEVLQQGEPRDLSFGISDEDAWAAGLSCGGTLRLLITPYDAALHQTIGRIIQAQASRRQITARTDLASGGISLVPAPESAKITLLDDICFIRTYRPRPHILVTGAVHIAQSLAQMAQITGYELTILDPRTGFATKERFPNIRLNTQWPKDFFRHNQPDNFTAIVALSHISHIDDPALIAALASDCFYIGALGSRKTHAQRLERLMATGFSADELTRIHAPIGLAISAQEPAEIATAVLAEIIQAYRN